MSNFLFPALKPIADFWNYITHDQTLADLEVFKGGQGNYLSFDLNL